LGSILQKAKFELPQGAFRSKHHCIDHGFIYLPLHYLRSQHVSHKWPKSNSRVANLFFPIFFLFPTNVTYGLFISHTTGNCVNTLNLIPILIMLLLVLLTEAAFSWTCSRLIF
jgi:hypothetical protein